MERPLLSRLEKNVWLFLIVINFIGLIDAVVHGEKWSVGISGFVVFYGIFRLRNDFLRSEELLREAGERT